MSEPKQTILVLYDERLVCARMWVRPDLVEIEPRGGLKNYLPLESCTVAWECIDGEHHTLAECHAERIHVTVEGDTLLVSAEWDALPRGFHPVTSKTAYAGKWVFE